jgi:hypothetical protein
VPEYSHLLETGESFKIYYREDDPTPIGVELPGDLAAGLAGKVLRVAAPNGNVSIHVVTDARYEEGYTLVSFLPGVPA